MAKRKTGHDFENFDGTRHKDIHLYRTGKAEDIIKDIRKRDGHELLRNETKHKQLGFQLLWILLERVEEEKSSKDKNHQYTLFQENFAEKPKPNSFATAFTRGIHKVKYVQYNRTHAIEMVKHLKQSAELFFDTDLLEDQFNLIEDCIKGIQKNETNAKKYGDRKEKQEQTVKHWHDNEKDFSDDDTEFWLKYFDQKPNVK